MNKKEGDLMNALNKKLNEDQKGFLLKKFLKFRVGITYLNALRNFYNKSCSKCQRVIIENTTDLKKDSFCDDCVKNYGPFNNKARALFEKAGARIKS